MGHSFEIGVRFVIHHSLNKSLETYYQESGYAGRDGLPVFFTSCLLTFLGRALWFSRKWQGRRIIYTQIATSVSSTVHAVVQPSFDISERGFRNVMACVTIALSIRRFSTRFSVVQCCEGQRCKTSHL